MKEMDIIDYLLAKKKGSGSQVTVEALSVTANGTYSEAGKAYSPVTVEVPLPTNANERKSVTSYPVTDSANYPLPKCDVTVTDADKCEVIVTTDNTITEDSGVYIERQSGGGNRELDAIVGGSIVWNQLVKDTDTSCTVQSGHKYVLKQGSTYTVVISDGTAFTVDGSVNDNVYDLTATFGSTIADYIYSLEQSTAGSGIAWLKSYGYLTEDYYGYTANKIESVSVARHITRGVNQWDEEWESGQYYGYPSIGIIRKSPDGTRIRTKNDIPVVPNTTYYLKSTQPIFAYFLDADKNWINRENENGTTLAQNGIFTTPDNCYYIMFFTINTETYNHDISINYPSTNTGYYAYHEPHTYPINPITLRGIPKLNASNQLYYDGDRYEASGRVTRKRARVVLDGKTNISGGASGMPFKADILLGAKPNSDATKLTGTISDKMIEVSQASAWGSDFTMSRITMAAEMLYFKLSNDITTIEQAKSYLTSNPITIEYELATPTTESTSPFEANQIVDANGTEEYIDAGVEAGTRDVAIPVGHETKYFNGKAYVKPLTAGTSDTISMADMGIMPTSPMYISANGSVDVEYWKSNQ